MFIEELISKIVEKNNGYITRKEINEAGIPSIYLTRYVKNNGLKQIVRGFYAKEEWVVDPYFVFQYTYPKFIYSFNSAIYLHGLGDILPNYLEVTGPLNYRPMSKARSDIITHTDTVKETYNLGIIKITTSMGNIVKCYDKEKTICDLVRFKEKTEFETYVKALNRYGKSKDIDVNKLIKYARIMKIEDKVRTLMEVIINSD